MKTLKGIVHSAVSRWAQKRQTEQNVPAEKEETVICEEMETSSTSDGQSSDIIETEESIVSDTNLQENNNTLAAPTPAESENESPQPPLSSTTETDQTIPQSDKQQPSPVTDITETAEPTDTTETTNDLSQDQSPSEEQPTPQKGTEPQNVSVKKGKPARFSKKQQQRKRSK